MFNKSDARKALWKMRQAGSPSNVWRVGAAIVLVIAIVLLVAQRGV